MTMRLPVRLLCCALIAAACDGTAAPRTPARVTVVSGNNQTGGVTENLPAPVVVEVSDDAVTFAATAGARSRPRR